MATSYLHDGVLSGLISYTSCTCFYSLWEFVCATAFFFSVVYHGLPVVFHASVSCNLSTPSPETTCEPWEEGVCWKCLIWRRTLYSPLFSVPSHAWHALLLFFSFTLDTILKKKHFGHLKAIIWLMGKLKSYSFKTFNSNILSQNKTEKHNEDV